MNEFWSIPQYIWEGIFSLLNVLGVGLLLAWFATRYQKRKEIELQLKANVLKHQLESYVKLNSAFGKIRSQIAPPLYREAYFQSIINTKIFNIKYMEYSSFFDSMGRFDEYYKSMVELQQTEHIYLQYDVEQKLSEYLNYLSEVKQFLDAYCDTERMDVLSVGKNKVEEHIRSAYQLTGICLQNDINRFYCQMDQLLAYEISHVSLGYKSHYIKSARESILKFISERMEKFIHKPDWKGKAAEWFYFKVLFRSYGNSSLINHLPMLAVHFAYLHYSDRYTPEQWLDLGEEKASNLILDFQTVFWSNLHHG